MATGTVKWWNPVRGFGFIVSDETLADIYVHCSSLQGVEDLQEGMRVTFEVATFEGRKSAQNVAAVVAAA